MVRSLCGLLLVWCLLVPGQLHAADDGLVKVRVGRHDSLIGLCRQYLSQPERWREVAQLNKLTDPDRLVPGQMLHVPVALLKATPMWGAVTFLKGSAQMQAASGGSWQPLQAQAAVAEGNTLKTGPDSALEVSFEDGTSFLMRENAQATVKQARKGPFHLVRVVYLKSGKVISRVKAATGRKSRFEIETPSAVAAARGTSYRVAVDEQEATRAEMLENTMALSAAGAAVTLQAGEGSLAKLNQPPLAPVKLLPPPQQTGAEIADGGRQAQFRFSQVAGAVRYRACLSRDQEAKDAVKTELLDPTAVFTVAGLRDGSYFLTVSSIDSLGLEGALSQPYPLSVQIAPLPPAWSGQVDDRTSKVMPFDLTWQPVSDAAGYQLQIARDAAFAEPVHALPVISGTSYRLAGLAPGQYHVRVRSLSSDQRIGPWSQPWLLSLAEPPAPVKQQPPRQYYLEALGLAGIVLMLVLL